MSSSADSLDELSDLLSRLSNKDEKIVKARSYLDELSGRTPRQTQSILSVQPNTDLDQTAESFVKLMLAHGISPSALHSSLGSSQHAWLSTTAVPCAYVKPSISDECLNAGTLTCTGCRLVSYCSKECQHKHWKVHSKDCKDPARSSDWKPDWVHQRRRPDYFGDFTTPDPLGMGLALWGNMPALNILSLAAEEVNKRSDISLAFVASGDLRNLIRTINNIPLDYSGNINVVLNDQDPLLTIRNILILRVLGTVPDKKRAVDIALHLWYSAFLPEEYHADILVQASSLMLGSHPYRVQLGKNSSLTAETDMSLQYLCSKICSSSDTYGVPEAARTYYDMRFNPSRTDLVHRRLQALRPSHRVALLKYFKYGLLLPFGAHDAHFNTPNRFLFWYDGRWVQTDFATPTDGWDIEEVMASGKAHGATFEDLFGCCYYHISDQLDSFVERLGRFKMSIKIFNEDAVNLSRSIAANEFSDLGIPSSIRFDRIEVSNIMDVEYVGIKGTINSWAKFLKGEKDATLVGYFMNWARHQPDGRSYGSKNSEDTAGKLVEKLRQEGRITIPSRENSKSTNPAEAMGLLGQMLSSCGELDSVYDNSRPFEAFLSKNGLDDVLRRHKLMRKRQHTIAPHRLCTPLSAKPSALPTFENQDSWYLQANISGPTWFERFVEIGRA